MTATIKNYSFEELIVGINSSIQFHNQLAYGNGSIFSGYEN